MARWGDREILERAEAAFNMRLGIQSYIDDCQRYGMPWRADPKKGRPNFDYIFDGSGPDGVQSFAKRLTSDLTPPFQRWFELKGGPLIGAEYQEDINRELSGATQIIHAALDGSNFQQASEETYADLSIGTGAMLGNEGDDQHPMVWKAVPPWALGIEEGPSGRVENVYWKRSYPAHQLPRHWPKAEWPENIREKITTRSRDEIEVLQASYYDSEDRIYRFHVLVRNGGDQLTVFEKENRTNPWVVPRWWTTSGDPWGRGPLMLALPDIKTANKTVEMILKAAAYSIAPPLMVLHDGVVNPDNLKLAPHAILRVARTGGPMGRSIEPLDMGGRVDLGQAILQDIRHNISNRLLKKTLPPATGAVRSPTEIIERVKDFAFETSSSFGRLNHEYVPPVIARAIDILDRKKVPLIDFEKLKIDQLILKVQVVSPLARGQALEDVQNTIRFIEIAKGIGGPEVMALIVPIEDALARIASAMGLPDWATRSKTDRAQMQKMVGQMMAEQQQQQQEAQQSQQAPQGRPQLRAV